MALDQATARTETSWNPLTGCTKISPGCAHCYAERFALRLQQLGQTKYARGFQLTLHEQLLEEPLRWRKPRWVFVNSMSDLFHEEVPEAFITRVFDVMRRASRHIFFVLTKRSERLSEMSPRLLWPNNVWMGVSVERGDYSFRLDHLRQTPAKVKVAVFEPLLGPVPGLDLKDIHWVIAGGETGPGARLMQESWLVDLRDQCLSASVPFFFKQWGSAASGHRGRLLQGRNWEEMPLVWQEEQSPNSPLFGG